MSSGLLPKLPLAEWVEAVVDWLTTHVEWLFNFVTSVIEPTVSFFTDVLMFFPPLVTIVIIALLAWWLSNWRIATFTLVGLLLIENLGYWEPSMETTALVLAATVISVIVGVPIGILCGKSDGARNIVTPVLDFMQTMPSFVYLIPAVIFFSLGTVPGVIASVVFSMPPTIRLTSLGIRQVPKELVEASDAFGSTSAQKLFKLQLPLAKTTIMAGINQTIMLALSMVVIASMIGAKGLGQDVLTAVQRIQVGQGFEAGLAIVIIAIVLDRVTQSVGQRSKNGKTKNGKK
ncbi:ABC transporter permease [Novibacillus thermophilus]|uniref:Glycine/betaine ABC transporter n=1 Tax=Novibacillus thermophilus TaxID=1471761 RepID=A0A1U9K4P5_9BACL|nr:proline/glycine betaine ABC transporter permease [Novibacillus thermophilus]AQS54993.1 glycine/betaine ABC transporter [Novibacillus thermophilus]